MRVCAVSGKASPLAVGGGAPNHRQSLVRAVVLGPQDTDERTKGEVLPFQTVRVRNRRATTETRERTNVSIPTTPRQPETWTFCRFRSFQ